MDCDSLVNNCKYNAQDLIRCSQKFSPLRAVYLKPNKRRLTAQIINIVHTNGVDELKEDRTDPQPKYQMLVPWLGVDHKRFEISDNIMIEIDSESTRCPIFCHMLHINEGGTTTKKTCKRLMRDACIQIGTTHLPLGNVLSQPLASSSSTFNMWSSDNEHFSTYYYFKNWCVNRDSRKKQTKSIQVAEMVKEISPIRSSTTTPPSSQISTSTRTASLSPSKLQNTQPLLFPTKHSLTCQNHILAAAVAGAAAEKQPSAINSKHVSVSTDTDDDFVAYLRLNRYPVTSLSLPHSIEMAYTKSRCDNYDSIPTKIRYRKLEAGSKRNPNLNIICIKQYVCPLTGAQQSSMAKPYESFIENDNSNLENYEEFYVVESGMDTSDIEKYIGTDKFLITQLFSNRALLENIAVLKEPIVNTHITPSPTTATATNITPSSLVINLSPIVKHECNHDVQKYEKIHQSFVETSKELEQMKLKSQPHPFKSINDTDELMEQFKYDLTNSMHEKRPVPLQIQRVSEASTNNFKELIDMINKKFEEINELKDKYCIDEQEKKLSSKYGYESSSRVSCSENSQKPIAEYKLSFPSTDDFYESQQRLKSRVYSSYKLNGDFSSSYLFTDASKEAEESSTKNLAELESRSRRSQNEIHKSQPVVKVKSKSSDKNCEFIYSKFDSLIKNACYLSSMNAKLMKDLTISS